PVFQRAREKARQTSCLSNIKQIAQAELMYESDNDERTAAICNWPVNVSSAGYAKYTWIDMLMPYVKNQQVFSCASTETGFRQWNVTTAAGTHLWSFGSYGTNRTPNVKGFHPYYNYVYAYRSTSSIEYPAECLLVADCTSPHFWVSVASDGSPRQIDARHNEGANVGFFDGHAKWVTEDTLETGGTNFWTGGIAPP
ncbi:MAG: DUF1559 domain-containing protein, partial [Armatimonadota bacterium]